MAGHCRPKRAGERRHASRRVIAALHFKGVQSNILCSPFVAPR
jgi:hypothetical protein